MATNKKPTDMTGRQREAAIKAAAEQQEQKTLDAFNAQAADQLNLEEVIKAEPARPTVIVDEVIHVGDTEPQTTVIRVVEDIEAMTFGAGNTYNFRAGQKYEVSVALAHHLKEKGYLANVL
jgi:hypothetical protein